MERSWVRKIALGRGCEEGFGMGMRTAVVLLDTVH